MKVAVNLMNHLMTQKLALRRQSLRDQAGNTDQNNIPGALVDSVEERKLQQMLELPSPISGTTLSLAHISAHTAHVNGKIWKIWKDMERMERKT